MIDSFGVCVFIREGRDVRRHRPRPAMPILKQYMVTDCTLFLPAITILLGFSYHCRLCPWEPSRSSTAGNVPFGEGAPSLGLRLNRLNRQEVPTHQLCLQRRSYYYTELG